MEASAERDRVFFVDDDVMAGQLWLRYVGDMSCDCQVFSDPGEALSQFQSRPADLVITDLRMPKMSGIELLKAIRAIDSHVPVIVITAYASLDSAIEALRLGATDFIKKPYDMDELRRLVDRALGQRKRETTEQESASRSRAAKAHYGMVGDSSPMQNVYHSIGKLASTQCNVIIQGESGTGKELVARAIHNTGPQGKEPFVVIDCGSIADSLLESELFGHRRGAFTGAGNEREGLLQAAGRGTVFLDEIGNISDAMQTKLLRVLQDGTFTPVGGTRARSISARFIAATNSDLGTLVEENRFRLDLYHRLNVFTLRVPSLNERPEDIPELTEFFCSEFAQRYQRPGKRFSPNAMHRLCERDWEGNVRELKNCVERCYIMSDGEWLDTADFFPEESCVPGGIEKGQETIDKSPTRDRRQEDLGQLEERHIREVLDSTGGNQSRAAEILGIHRTTLWRKLRYLHKKK